MKILESYKKMAHSLMMEAEIDDEKIIKYKDKDGESQEMTAGAAKKQSDDHPAKQVYNKMKGDGGDDSEKDSADKLGGSDFERDDDPTGGDPDDAWDDEEGRAKPKGKTDADTDDEPAGKEESPEARLEKIDSEIEDIEDQRRIVKQHMTSSGGGGVSRSRRDQLEKEDKELLAKWRELQWARDDIQDEIDAKGEQEDDEPTHAEIMQYIEDEGYGGDAIQPDGNPTPEAYQDAKDELMAMRKKDETITFNGQKYRPIKESKQHILKENYERFFGSRK